MINLTDDRLTFTFPEIAGQLVDLLEPYIRRVLPQLRLPDDRSELVRALKDKISKQSDFQFRPDALKTIDAYAAALTEAHVERALRDYTEDFTYEVKESLATGTIEFQRTLRIPDDGTTYPLPAGLGRFPIRSVDDFAGTIPATWLKRGGVLIPMDQSEALWIRFSSGYPFAVKIAAGKINAVSGGPWSPDLQREPQNYVVLPDQPWLDGFAVGYGLIRQFVAMPLGAGYSVEEQLTGKAEVGGIQIQVHPLRAEVFFQEKVAPLLPSCLDDVLIRLFFRHVIAKRLPLSPFWLLFPGEEYPSSPSPSQDSAMGLGAGGRMRQEIYADPHPAGVWDETQSRRCFIHLCNSLVWRQITGTKPPHPPLTAQEYQRAGIPWFDYYRDDQKPLPGSKRLAGVKSVAQLGQEKHSQPLPENSSIVPELTIQYGNTRRPGEIREFFDAQ